MTRDIAHLLRSEAVSRTLFPPTTLKAAIKRLGFVQADPIRAPARAQDLILRHRVKGYRVGDLERTYASLDIEEDFLYAYGFLPRATWRLLHPRNTVRLSRMEKKVYDTICKLGATHPKEMEAHCGVSGRAKRVENAWGGQSKATTRALESLHYRGLLRVARREQGIRIYEAAPQSAEQLPPAERLREAIMLIVSILSPVTQRTLFPSIWRYRGLGNPRAAVDDLVREGALEQQTIDGLSYFRPAGSMPRVRAPSRLGSSTAHSRPAPASHRDSDAQVRFLAPFDPVVWDRQRFRHLWGWAYTFEAYTPPAKRLRGYYAMPLLWGDRAIGWANAQLSDGRLDVQVGFASRRPTDKAFADALDLEIERLRACLV